MTAEASSTDAAESGASACGTATASVVLAVVRSSFGSTTGDQLIAKRPIRVATEHPAQALRRGATAFDLGLIELGCVGHVPIVTPAGRSIRSGGKAPWSSRRFSSVTLVLPVPGSVGSKI